MTESMWIELIKDIPSILTCLVGLVVFLTLKKPIVEKLIPAISEIKGLGIEIKLVKEKIESTVKSRAAALNLDYDLGVIKRAEKNIEMLRGKKILWVDDNISWIKDEVDVYSELKMIADISTTTESALEKLRNFNYDLIISDISRYDSPMAGLELLEKKKAMNDETKMIFYVGALNNDKGVPPGAFGITNRLDELIHLTIDCFERTIN